MSVTSFAEFEAHAVRHSVVPVIKEVLADQLTPVAAFLKVAELSDHAFLLESVVEDAYLGRYSFLGKDPLCVLRADGEGTVVERRGETMREPGRIDVVLDHVLRGLASPSVPGAPPLLGGAVGYAAVEPPGPSGAEVLRAEFMVFDTLLVFDHLHHRMLMVANARLGAGADRRAEYEFACARIGFLERELERPLSRSVPSGWSMDPGARDSLDQRLAGLEAAARPHLEASECSHVVVCERAPLGGIEAFGAYRALRHTAPSAYMFFLRMGSRTLCGSSSEAIERTEARGAHVPAGTPLSRVVSRVPAASTMGAPPEAARRVAAAIDEEPRGLFGGAVGYVDFAGNMDFCAATRLIVVEGSETVALAGARLTRGATSAPTPREMDLLWRALALQGSLR